MISKKLFPFIIFIYFFKYEIIETHARAFLALNISTVGSVHSLVLHMNNYAVYIAAWVVEFGSYSKEVNYKLN